MLQRRHEESTRMSLPQGVGISPEGYAVKLRPLPSCTLRGRLEMSEQTLAYHEHIMQAGDNRERQSGVQERGTCNPNPATAV
jgi:hypothetical protein